MEASRCGLIGTWAARPGGKNAIDLRFGGECFGSSDAVKGVACTDHCLLSGQDVHQGVVMSVTPEGAGPRSVRFHGCR